MPTQIRIEDVRVHQAQRKVFNQPALEDIEFVYKNRVVKPDPEWIKEFAFTGLNNIHFIEETDWDVLLDEDAPKSPREIVLDTPITIIDDDDFDPTLVDDGPFNGPPNNLEEAVAMILPQLTPANIEDIKHIKDEDEECVHGRRGNMDMYICLNGMAIRNDWNLWYKSNLSQWFADHGIYHADDVSGVICKAVWCNLTGNKLDIEYEAEQYKNWWDMPGHGGNDKVKAEYYERCKRESDR